MKRNQIKTSTNQKRFPWRWTKASPSHDDGSELTNSSSSGPSSSPSSPVPIRDDPVFNDIPDLNDIDFSDVSVDEDARKFKFKETVLNLLRPGAGKTNRFWRNRAYKILAAETELTEAINEDYTEILLDQAHVSKHGVDVHLCAADHIVNELVSLKDVVKESFLPDSLEEMLFGLVEHYIGPRISDQYSDLSKVTPEEAALAVTWIQKFLKLISSDFPKLEPNPDWRNDERVLIDHYIKVAIRQEFRRCLEKTVQAWLDFEPRQNNDGHAVTDFPAAIAFLLDSQRNVAQERLPAEFHEEVYVTCVEELIIFVAQLEMTLGESWQSIGSGMYCAMINDANHLAELLESRNETMLQSEGNTELGEELIRAFSEFALHLANYLCEKIVNDLRDPDPILTNVGSSSWENEEGENVVSQTIATFEDYFQDLQEWIISSFYIPRILKQCFDLTMKMYVESFFENTMDDGVQNAQVVSRRLKEDYFAWVHFFNGSIFEAHHGVPGFYSPQDINYRLHILQSLSNIVNPEIEHDDLAEDIKCVLREIRCADKGTPAVLHLVGLRKRHTPAESLEWTKVIGRAKKAVFNDEKESNCTLYYYDLPDLSRSHYVGNLRHVSPAMMRKLSVTSRKAAESTNNLLQKSPQQVAKYWAHRGELLLARGKKIATTSPPL